MEKITFVNGQAPSLNATNLNQLQDNVENAIDNYSTTEKKVGKWIDNKPIYQKTLHVVPTASGENCFAHNISNIDKVVHADAFLVRGSNAGTFMPLPFVYPLLTSAWSGGLHSDRTEITITLGTSLFADMNSDGAYVTLKYTKTTD